MAAGLDKLQEKHPIILRHKHMGMMFSIELTSKKGEFVPFENPGAPGSFVNAWCYEKEGCIIRNNVYNKRDNVVWCPALTFTNEMVDKLVDALDKAMTAAEEKFGVQA